MEDIEAELESKTIERVEVEDVVEDVVEEADLVEDTPPHTVSVTPKKAKKPRSAKQIEAFEKARVKRAEGIAARKAKKEEDKIKKKEAKKEKLQDVPVVESQVSVPKPVVNVTTPSNNPRDQVIQNHYYYYGVPPPNHDYNEPNKKNKKSSRKRPPTPSSSESESEEEQQHEQQYYEQPKPSYKFGFA